jgi:hypothetical protein
MILWFAGVSLVLVWAVFQSPALDYRLVMLGSVLPVGEGLTGAPRLAHTLVFAAGVLLLVVVFTPRRRLLRRRLIGLPIGLMMHLVLDATWARAELFWWPVLGSDTGGGQIPEVERAVVAWVVLDAVGAACLVWAWRRFGLDDPARRAVFVRTGQVRRDVVG